MQALGAKDHAIEVYLAIATDTTEDGSYRMSAARELANLGAIAKAMQGYVSIARTADLYKRFKALDALEKLGETGKEKAIEVWLSMITDQISDKSYRSKVEEASKRLLPIAIEKYSSIAMNTSKSLSDRFKAAKVLEVLEEKARTVHKTIATNTSLHVSVKARTVYKSIATNTSLHVSDRRLAAEALVRLREIEEAIAVYESIAMATDTAIGASDRVLADEALKRLGAIEKYSSIAMNTRKSLPERFKAAKALERLRAIEEAKKAFASLLKAGTVSSNFEAREALARLREMGKQ